MTETPEAFDQNLDLQEKPDQPDQQLDNILDETNTVDDALDAYSHLEEPADPEENEELSNAKADHQESLDAIAGGIDQIFAPKDDITSTVPTDTLESFGDGVLEASSEEVDSPPSETSEIIV